MYYLNLNKLLVIVIILFVFLLWVFCDRRWAPSYPVEAEVFYRPGSSKVKAPFSGIIKVIYPHDSNKINQNDILLVLENLHHLSIDDEEKEKFLMLKKQSKALKKEMAYQKILLQRISQLVKRKLLSENEYHLKCQQYYQLLSNYQNVNEKIHAFNQKHMVFIKAPISGKLLHLNFNEGEQVTKNKVLLRITPHESEPWVKLKLPYNYQEVVETGQHVKLSKPTQSFIKKYPYEAIIREISFVSSHGNHSKYYVAKAQFIHHFDLQELAPMTGFVIGKPQKIWYWLISNWN